MTSEERAKAFADRHQEAELELRGLGATYGYQRIYNAERCAYERGATEQEVITREEITKKAQDWIYWNVRKYIHVDSQGIAHINETEISEDLRKALEE